MQLFKKLLIICVTICFSYAQDEEENQQLRIEYKTALSHADYCLNGGDEKASKERKTIGIGEEITLTLTGKPLGEPKEITWKIEGEGLTKQEDSKGGDPELKGESVTLVASKNLTGDKKCKVTATTSLQDKKEIEIEILVPKDIEVEHINGGASAWPILMSTPLTNEIIGAGMCLQLKLLPMNVNFSNISTIETDGGSIGKSPLNPGHTGSGAYKVRKCPLNHVWGDACFKYMDYKNFKAQLPDGNYDQWYEWVCQFCVYTGGVADDGIADKNDPGISHKFKEVNQKFLFEDLKDSAGWIDKIPYIKVTISKFGKSVTRNNKENKEEFK